MWGVGGENKNLGPDISRSLQFFDFSFLLLSLPTLISNDDPAAKIDGDKKKKKKTPMSLPAAHVVIMSTRVCQNIQAACDHALVMRRI